MHGRLKNRIIQDGPHLPLPSAPTFLPGIPPLPAGQGAGEGHRTITQTIRPQPQSSVMAGGLSECGVEGDDFR